MHHGVRRAGNRSCGKCAWERDLRRLGNDSRRASDGVVLEVDEEVSTSRPDGIGISVLGNVRGTSARASLAALLRAVLLPEIFELDEKLLFLSGTQEGCGKGVLGQLIDLPLT